jgi:hypothetical protein
MSVSRELLGAHHLLDLVADRLEALEEEDEVVPELDAPPVLRGHRRGAETRAPVVVRRPVEEIRSCDALHPAASVAGKGSPR